MGFLSGSRYLSIRLGWGHQKVALPPLEFTLRYRTLEGMSDMFSRSCIHVFSYPKVSIQCPLCGEFRRTSSNYKTVTLFLTLRLNRGNLSKEPCPNFRPTMHKPSRPPGPWATMPTSPDAVAGCQNVRDSNLHCCARMVCHALIIPTLEEMLKLTSVLSRCVPRWDLARTAH